MSKNTTSSGRRKPLRPCATEGCGNRAKGSGPDRYCSPLCRWFDLEFRATRNLCESLGANPAITALWAALASVADARAAYIEKRERIKQTALDCGITPEQWRALRHG